MNRRVSVLAPPLNPVDWFSLGRRSLRKSETRNKPVLVSIGYSTCHWVACLLE
ncbi:DUF255 domain-containing protein [Bacillus sonorensis]|uniref:DUF255 domain-containing protein n=1 Tax=Bacillus sonorensis TaxID=119858 RepID=UPI001C3F8977